MKRETRANLLFIALFLGISLPGAVILFKKKLDPTSAPMSMPDAIRRRLPYMVPLVTPDSQVIRVIPPLTGVWVEELTRERGNGSMALRNGHLPFTSVNRVVQIAGVEEGPASTTVHLLAWDEGYGTDPARYRVTATSGDASFAGRVVRATTIPMPQPVKRELMSGGFVKPPGGVTWIEVAFDAPVTSKRPLALQLSYGDGGEAASATLNVFKK